MKVGITATRAGLTPLQKHLLAAKLKELGATEMHHGDCVGGDADAHAIGRALGLRIVGHPPNNPSQRAFCNFDEEREPDEYLARNRQIVAESAHIIALPKTSEEKWRGSGTWATIRYTKTCHRPFTFLPGDINDPQEKDRPT